MFTAADDAKLGVPVVHSAYPNGEEGIQKSLATICQKVREGAPTAAMKSFAGNMMREAGFPNGARAQGQAVLDYIRANAMYAPDALGTEQIQSAAITLCVKGAPLCIPIYDCDDGVTAVATVLAALGLEVEIVRQIFGAGHQQHVIVEVKDENDNWIPLDPSSKTMPAGTKVPAQQETRHSPFDTGPRGAQFVGIGALPLFIWKKERWVEIGLGSSVEDAALADATCPCDKKDGLVKPMPRETEHTRGFGAPWPGVTAFVPQWAWLRQFWPAFDANRRSWEDTLAAARIRARDRRWTTNDPVARSDFEALVIASAFSARAVASMPDQGQSAADALNGTWLVIAKQLGYTPDMTIDKLKERVTKEQSPATAAAQLGIIELLIIVVYIAGLVTVYCFVFYYAPRIIDTILARILPFAELIYLETQVQEIVDKHLEDPNRPWTQEEKDLIQNLQDLQRGAHGSIQRPAPPPGEEATPAWVWISGAVVVTGGVLAVVYRDEIKRWLNTRSPKRLGASEARRRRRYKAA